MPGRPVSSITPVGTASEREHALEGEPEARGAGSGPEFACPSPLPPARPPAATSSSSSSSSAASAASARRTGPPASSTPTSSASATGAHAATSAPATGWPAPARPAASAPATGWPAPATPATSAPATGEYATGPSTPATPATSAPGTGEYATGSSASRSSGAGPYAPSARAAGTSAGGARPVGDGVSGPAPRPQSASPDAVLIGRTLDEIEPVADKVTSYFYALLFVRHPELRALFPAAMDAQRDRLFRALLTSVKAVDDTDTLTDYLSHLGRGHRKYGTLPEHYPAVGECLLNAIARYAHGTWHPEAEAAWVRAYTTISQIMIDAAAENEAVAPAWWHAEVVSHELRTPDIAVVTVRPDQPYPFLAGQYASLETPWWPRVWRHYSFAAAPRSDGLLSFHVKAVPAGWVSNAMVHRARPGDVLRLGPPSGSMTVDHTTDNGLLCLGGGTGIAPIKALVEDVAERGRRRPMEVFYGARSDYDLYDIDTMLRMAQSHPWLSVRPVVATGPAGGPMNSLSGQLPDAVRQYGPWREYDAYLSGPPGMIRNGVDALVGVGIPSDRIRHDSVEELVAAGD
ncbi:globin domain-containing protein [Streptomyces sp. NPDC007100]|uniref:globin domain-containing protein n=1 Tax=Streptomyces sp. NPDC007100 TaxID=3155602 RepID=UPI0033DF85DC